MTPLFAFLSPAVLITLGVIGVIIFGRRLPEMMDEFKSPSTRRERRPWPESTDFYQKGFLDGVFAMISFILALAAFVLFVRLF